MLSAGAGAIENCGDIGVLQLPHNYAFKALKTFNEAQNLCEKSGLKLPQFFPNMLMKKCVTKFQERMKKHMGFLPPVWFDVDYRFQPRYRRVVCFVGKFNQAMLRWECVHGKLIDPVWHDGSVYVTLHIIVSVFYQYITYLDLIQSHGDWLGTE